MKDFFDGLLDTDKFEKVVSRVEGKNHTLFITKMAKIDSLFMTKNGWKTIPCGAAHTYIELIREYLHLPWKNSQLLYHRSTLISLKTSTRWWMTFVEYVKVALHVIILLNRTVIMSIIAANSVLIKIGQTIQRWKF